MAVMACRGMTDSSWRSLARLGAVLAGVVQVARWPQSRHSQPIWISLEPTRISYSVMFHDPPVKLRTPGIEDALSLVTDARGRMRYRLPDGEYQLSLLGGPCVRFVVRDRCWTTVRLQPA